MLDLLHLAFSFFSRTEPTVVSVFFTSGLMWYLVAPAGQVQVLLTGDVGSRRVVRDVVVFVGVEGHRESVVRPGLCDRLQETRHTDQHHTIKL